MIILKATTETLEIVTSSTAGIDFSVSWVDVTTTTFTPSTTEGKVTTATTTTITAAPAASTQRQIKLITLRNIHASTSNTISVNKDTAGTKYKLTPEVILLAGEVIQYMDGIGWTYYSATGEIKSSSLGFAPIASPAFTGTPTAPTAGAGANTTQLATTAFVTTSVSSLKLGAFGVTITGNGGIIGTGVQGFLTVPYAGTITGWDIFSTIIGSIVIDVWKDTYANFPPTVADTIAGSQKPTLISARNNQNNSLSAWTTAVAANDIIAFNVDSASLVTNVNVIIRITKT